jgi:pimeloyl-ACP methyl ester carboxylesterase
MTLLRLCCLLAGLTAAEVHALSDHPLDYFASPPGMLVDVGTHRLHLYCRGHGGPAVIFDSGIGGLSLEWAAIQRRVSEETRVCLYDRAGYGWSESGPLPRTSDRIAAELKRLLERGEVAAPYILVGHSFGGYTVQLFARRYPWLAAGMVLVDSSHPQQAERFPVLALRPERMILAQARGRWEYDGAREPRRRAAQSRPQIPANYPTEARLPAIWLMSLPKTGRTLRRELADFERSGKAVEQAARFPRIPLIVLSRGRRVWTDDSSLSIAKELAWSELQRDLAQLSNDTQQVIGHDSGHMLHLDQPGLVVAATLQLINRYRASASGGL